MSEGKTDKSFDVRKARAELQSLQKQARRLEASIQAQLHAQLRDLLLGSSQAREVFQLLEDLRAFLDPREAA